MTALAAQASLFGAVPELKLPSKTVMEIHGGSGKKAWTIRYGTMEMYPKKLAPAGEDRAWLSHGGWLRLLDTEKGVVTGRWHFPGSIVHLTPVAGGVQVQIQEKAGDRVFTQLSTFHPENAATIPYWPTNQLFLNFIAVTEVASMWGTPPRIEILAQGWKLTPEQDAKSLTATLEEAARRDPLDSIIRLALWRVLRESGDARAAQVLEEALSVPGADFSEQLRMASLLESLEEPGAARKAFEAGYKSFLDRGNDPRLMTGLIGKAVLYPNPTLKPPDVSTEHGRELLERHYRLGPYAESADLAWLAYAGALESQGRAEDGKRWRERAEAASSTSLFLLPRRVALTSDILLVLIFAALVSACSFVVLLMIGYRPQRQADAAANPHQNLLVRILSAFSFQHWSLAQRVSFLSITLVAWVCLGIESGILRGIIRVAATPINLAAGSLAGPVAQDYLEKKVPASPERDLMIALAHQQSGRADRAEKLYRSLPGFAESWNNLGVLLRAKGNETEAKQAFEKALQMDPGLEEAALNLGQPPRGYWAEQYARYFPGRSMLAPPRPQRIATALFGSTMRQTYLRGLAGPFADLKSIGATFAITGTGSEDAPAGDIFIGLVLAVCALSVALLFVPSRPATQAPPRAFLIAQVLFPGVSPAWSFLGGLALLGWTFFLQQLYLIFAIGSPYLLTSIAQPSLARTYNVPAAGTGNPLHIFNPGWFWSYGAPLVLFVVNLALVALARRRQTPEGSGPK